MDIFGICKIGSIAAGMLSGGLGVVAAVPDLKEAIGGLKKDDIPEVKTYTDEDGNTVTEF